MAASQKPTRQKQPLEPLTSRLFPLTRSDVDTLAVLTHDMTDRLGRAISAAAVIRALIRLAGDGQVESAVLVEGIEQELQAGRLWGKKRH
jgi:hypothetical protein